MALSFGIEIAGIKLLAPFLMLTLLYFARLSSKIAVAFAPVVLVFVALIIAVYAVSEGAIWPWLLGLFAISWVALLIGHRIEGRAPSVFQNPALIVIGPAWLMARVFRRFGFEPKTFQNISKSKRLCERASRGFARTPTCHITGSTNEKERTRWRIAGRMI